MTLVTMVTSTGGERRSEVSDLPKCSQQSGDSLPQAAYSFHLPSDLTDKQKSSPIQYGLTLDALSPLGPAPNLPCLRPLSHGPGTVGQQREALLGAGSHFPNGEQGDVSPHQVLVPQRASCGDRFA